MSKINKLLLLCLVLLTGVPASAQNNDETPMLTIWTNRYQQYGDENVFQMSMTALQSLGHTNVEVDFGYGRQPFAISSDANLGEDADNEVVTGGSLISGSVSPDGVVRVYGDPTSIDYLDCHGSNVTAVDISRLTNLAIFECGHNEIVTLNTSGLTYLEYLDVKDNPFTQGLYLGEHNFLKYLNVNQLGDRALDNVAGILNVSRYPALNIFTAWDSHCLRSIDVTGCPNLIQLSIDNTGVTSLDLSGNPYLRILNISDCGFQNIDLSHNEYLIELYADNQGQDTNDRKLSALDLSHNTYLQRITCSGNNLTSIDISKQWNLVTLEAHHNHLSRIDGIDCSLPQGERPDSLAYLGVTYNNFDFTTLPMVDPRTEFEYESQFELPVEKEYGVGEAGKLDLSRFILREGTTTAIALAGIARDGFSYDYQLVDGEDFLFDEETGVITFLKAQNDSVQVACFNDVFNGCVLLTQKFLVRSAEEYGTPVECFNMIPSINVNAHIGITTHEDETLYVDFGDGNKQPFTTVGGVPATLSGVAVGAIRVYGRVATVFDDITIDHLPLSSIDVTNLSGLKSLNITNCMLEDIDLGWNHLLTSLNLSGNKLTALDLNGENNAFNKNVLRSVNVSNNSLVSFDPGLSSVTIDEMDCSNNLLTEINLNTMARVRALYLNNNKLATVRLDDCAALQTLDISGNMLNTIDISMCPDLSDLNISRNLFTFASLPEAREGMTMAPQQNIRVASRAMSVDLSAQDNIRGTKTTFTWKDVSTGRTLVAGTDYTINAGKTVFAEGVVGQTLRCEMENALYPDFTGKNVLKTTNIIAAGMPQYCIASFTTPVGGETALLSLASTEPDTYIYIDWGDGDLKEYPLQTMYTVFRDDKTIGGANVKVYSGTAPHGNMYVFSTDSITMQNLHVENMTELYCLSINHAGIDDIDISQNMKLGELILEGNHFTSIDLTEHRTLNYVVLSNNELTEFRLPQNNHIGWFAASYNNIDNVDWSQLSDVYSLDLAGNNISEIDMTKMPGLGQLFIAQNNLHEIDLSAHPNLYVLDIAANKFDFATLPNPSIPVFFYGKQQPLDVECVDGRIDLTSQVTAWEQPSEIYFFDGTVEVVVDEDGNAVLEATELYEGTDFFNNGGIITFAEDHEGVTGLIVNELYPSLLLYTKLVAVTADPTGIETVETESNESASYNILGRRVSSSARGLIIRNGRCYLQK